MTHYGPYDNDSDSSSGEYCGACNAFLFSKGVGGQRDYIKDHMVELCNFILEELKKDDETTMPLYVIPGICIRLLNHDDILDFNSPGIM